MARKYVRVQGQVQKVMFRQTLIRAMIKRGLTGGASNNRQQRDVVDITMDGDTDVIDDLVEALRTTKPLNSWGAQVDTIKVLPSGVAVDAHQVTTTNVDDRSWNPNVEMYL
ncbi:hypothetical protein H310_08101 [Aphanomyces invadans]|uniref:acylphosphatase n=1 Tax=Aphanomyces invadans TaxID=157072 RepID=A0A024U1E6_9STRA|nr:hypothetical protein H310_08101 [Aphanomyces invadans]ETV99397.1 hypothetical protein H310_08101 [Aphanomyces invadans]|eukprot:XP_008871953.1 hypothetical protein H310_08101 [Aphanomyces invadans]